MLNASQIILQTLPTNINKEKGRVQASPFI